MATKKQTVPAQPDENVLKMVSFISSLGLNWTFRSVDALTSVASVSLGQLRTGVFQTPSGLMITDTAKATRFLLASGWIKTSADDINALQEKAFDVLDKFSQEHGSIVILHSLLVQVLTDKHFFMADLDIQKLSKVGEVYPVVADLATAHTARELQEMTQQVMSYNG